MRTQTQLQNLLTRPAGRGTIRRPSQSDIRFRPYLELLESRLAPAVSLLNHFDGLTGVEPPDTCGAAGPNSYIESINYSAAIYNKSTNAVIGSDTLSDFFHTVGGIPQPDANGGLADVTMAYDEIIGRFIVASLDLDRSANPPIAPSQVDFAVSTTSNPTAMDAANWRFYRIGTTEGTAWSDYPGNIGYNHDALVFTWNMIGAGHVLVDALSQSDLAAGGTVGFTYFDYAGSNLRPVTMHDSVAGDPMWFVTEHGDSSSIDLKRFDNILGNTVNDHTFNIGVSSYGDVNNPLDANGTYITSNTNGSKILKAAERYNTIVASQQVGVGTTENDARWYEFNVSDPNNPYRVDQGNVSAGNNTYIMMPGIDINPAGDIGMSYIKSGNDTSTDYLSVYVTGRKSSDAAGTMEPSVLIWAGDSNNNNDGTDSKGKDKGGREGDFSGINVDPSDGTFWIANEYTGGGSAHTAVANFAMNTQTLFVNNGQLQIYGDQLGANYNDSIFIGVDGRGGVYASLNGEVASFDFGQITSIYIDPRGGTNTVQVNNVPANCGVDITGDGVNNVTVGSGTTGVQGINSVVFVYNGYPTPSTTGTTALTINDAADTVGRNATLTDLPYGVGSYQRGYLSGLAPAAIEWFDNSAGGYTGGVEAVTIEGGSGGNTFNLQQDGNLYNGTHLVGNSSVFGPDDTVNIGSGGSAQGIVGVLNLSNPTGFDNITVDDSQDGTARTTTINSSSVTGLTPAYITYASGDTHSLTIMTGNAGGNVVNIQSTARTTNVIGNVDSRGPDDIVNIGNAGSVQSIVGAVSLSNPPGFDIITLDNSLDGTARTTTITSSSITGLAPAPITYASGDAHSLTVKTGNAGGNIVNIQSTGTTTNVIGNAPLGGPDDNVNIGNAGSVQGIAAALNLSNPTGYDNITVDDSADGVGRTTTMTAGSITGLAPATITYTTGDFHSLTVKTGTSGTNVVNIQSASQTTNVIGNGPLGGLDDTVNIGNAGSVQSIVGTLNLSNPTGYDDITIDDSADGTAGTTTITSSSVTGLAPATINYVSVDTRSLTVKTGTASGDTVNVPSTGDTTNVVGNNYEVVNIGSAGSAQAVTGGVHVSNLSASYTYLNVDDSADATASTVAMNDGSMTGLAPGGVFWTPTSTFSGGVAYLIVLAGTGGNTFNISNTSNFGTGYTLVETGTGNDTVNVQATGGGTYVYNNGGSDTVTVGSLAPGLGGTLANINGFVQVYGPGFTSLVVDDSGDAAAETVAMNDGNMTGIAPAAIQWVPTSTSAGGVGLVHVLGGSGGNTFNITNTSNLFNYTWVETGSGNDTANILGSQSTLYVYTGAGNNAVNVQATGASSSTFVYNDSSVGVATVTIGSLAPTLGGTLANINGLVDVYGVSGSSTALIVDDSGDGTSSTATLNSSELTGLGNAGAIDYNPNVTALTIYGPAVGSTYNIESTSSATTVNGGGGNDAFNITPTSQQLGDIAGALTVNGGGSDTITVNDQADVAVDTYTIATGSVQRTGSAGVTYTGMANATVNGGSGAVTYNVNSTASGTPLGINAGVGANIINLTSGNLDTLAGAVTVSGGGASAVIVDDHSSSATQTYTVTSSNVGRVGFAGLTYNGLAALTLKGGSGADTYNVQSTASGTPTTANGGAASDTFNVGSAANVLDAILGALTVNGNGGSNNVLNVHDQGNAVGQSFTLTPTQLTRSGGASITYSTMKSLTIQAGSGDDAFTASAAPIIATTVDLGAGTNTLTGPNATNTWMISATNHGTLGNLTFSNARNLVGGTGADTFRFTGGNITGNVSGGGGADKLDYSANGGVAIAVNLQIEVATSIGGTFSGISSLVGSTALTNTLTGPNANSTWKITANNGGMVGAFTFASIQNLTGGTASDIFTFSNGKGVTGTVNGGGGTNTLDYALYTTGVNVNLGTGTATGTGGISNFLNVNGGSGNDTIAGNSAGNTIRGNGGKDTLSGGGNATFILGITQTAGTTVTGAGTGNTLVGAHLANTWTLTGAGAGNLNGITTFTGIANLTGDTLADTFKLQPGGSVAGTINGGAIPGVNTLDYSGNGGTAIAVNLQLGTATGTGGFTNVGALIGSSAATDTLTGANATNTWTITGANTGTLNAFTFSAIENLTGGTGADTFKLKPGGSVAGTVNGGAGANTLDYSGNGGTAIAVNLQSGLATSTGGFANITNLVGSTATTDTLTGPNTTNAWSLTGTDSGKVNAFTFSAIEDLVGGTGVDVFTFSAAGKATRINGGGAPANQGDWLDYSAYATAVTVNLATGAATNVNGGAAGSVSNIQHVHGGNGGNTLTGNFQGNILIGGTGANTITGGSGRSILIGDKGASTITGGSGDSANGGDILIAGSTTFDPMTAANEAALMSLLAEWQLGDTYATRFHDINTGTGGGLNGSNKLNYGTTVLDNGKVNKLTAQPGAGTTLTDWFFGNVAAGHTTIINQEAGEHLDNV